MKVAFLSELNFEGKVPPDYPNMRTEFAWMIGLDADHINIRNYQSAINYDVVFIIFPKGNVYLNAAGSKLINGPNSVSELLQINLIETLKLVNKKVFFVQEGPSWWFHNYELEDQIHFINYIRSSDGIFAHNECDFKFWKGYTNNVFVIPTLMIDSLISDIKWQPQNKTIIGGNFSRWYGGMSSYITAQQFDNDIFTISSHAQRDNEEHIVQHLPRLAWLDWMRELSTFKYAVHLMPTIAAGTFNLNCAYFGIPCIGNEKVDTQRLCHPDLSIDVDDVESAVRLAKRLKIDSDFYTECSNACATNYKKFYSIENFKSKFHE